jgi:hypothetical protein
MTQPILDFDASFPRNQASYIPQMESHKIEAIGE